MIRTIQRGSLIARAAAKESRAAALTSLPQNREIHTSAPRFMEGPRMTMFPPLPPPEFEYNGEPRRYPLHQTFYDHGYTWEHWHLLGCGVFHTIYLGDLAVFNTPYHAWMGSMPFFFSVPLFVVIIWTTALLLTKSGGIGIKPKRYTVDWMAAMKERERVENTNPISRYLDRRLAERGHHLHIGDILPNNNYFMWMHNSYDHEWREERGLSDMREPGAKWNYKPGPPVVKLKKWEAEK